MGVSGCLKGDIWCFKSIPRVFLGRFEVISRLFHGCFKKVSGVFHKSFKGV